MLRSRALAVGLCAFLASTAMPSARAADPRNVRVSFARVASGLVNPVAIAFAPDGTGRSFIVEQAGRIRVRTPSHGLLSTPFLDIRDIVRDGGERGLLGLAFHPSFRSNGFFYVFYTRSDGDLFLARFHARPGSNIASRTSIYGMLAIEHSQYSNHNGGQLQFGKDGFLYIATGDGGGGGDPLENGQNTSTLLGKILRIDVNRTCSGKRYCIPSTNPFGNEVFHYGLRNPWRFSFDRVYGSMWIGDAGQNAWEEINAVPDGARGRNFGWDCREGFATYESSGCSGKTFTNPAYVYGHSGGRCVVIGGYTYRGSLYRVMSGIHVFADYCSGEVFGLARLSSGWVASRMYDHAAPITSFGESPGGELYAVDANGDYWHLRASAR